MHIHLVILVATI